MITSPPVTVVKLGGSIVTRKSEEFRLRPKVLVRLAEELARGWEKGAHPLVVLHGAGSFAHPLAKAYHLDEELSHRPSRPRGPALTAYGVRRLHLQVMKALLEAGLPARSLPPFPAAVNRTRVLERFDVASFRRVLETGEVPVSFGDVVEDLDPVWGCSILSADQIAHRLAKELPAPRVLFVSDVPGVWVPAPHGGQQVLAELGEEVPASLKPPEPSSGRKDATGGIRKKVEWMIRIHETGSRAGLISGLQRDALSRALRGETVNGTWTREPVPRHVRAPSG